MRYTNWIDKYYQEIINGGVVVGEYIEAAYKFVLDGIAEGRFFYDQKKAQHAINWIEEKCHHSEGELAPDTLKLELWQKALIAVVFGVVDEDGIRQFREVFLLVGRKNGKSLLASAIIEYMLYEDDEYGARIYCVAPKLDQADIVYDTFWHSVQLDDELRHITQSRKSDKYVKSTNSQVKKIALNEKTNDGFNAHLYVADEIHAWRGEKGLRQYEVMVSGLGARRQPMVLTCTTAGYENDGIFDELVKRSTRLLKGDSKETRLMPFIYMIDDIEKWNDIEELQKANPNLNVSVSTDFLLEEIAKAESSLSKKAEFLTKHCNIKQNSSQAWLSTETVTKAIGEPLRLDDFRSTYAVAGIDLSQTTDLTACTVVIERDGILNVFAKFWLPAEKIDEASERDGVPYNIYLQKGWLETSGDNFVDYNDCANWLKMLVEEYEILPLQVGYDRYSAQYLVQDLEAYGFRCDDVYQGDNLHGTLQEFEGLIKDGVINIGDNDLLKMHLLNSALKHNTQRNRSRLIKVSPNAHIDGVAALIDAMTVRQKWNEEIGEQLKNEG